MALHGLSASVQGVASSSVKLADMLSVCRSETRGKSEKLFFAINFVQLPAADTAYISVCEGIKGHFSVRDFH